MNILSNKIQAAGVIIVLTLGLMSCGADKSSSKSNSKTQNPSQTYSATSLDCDFQKNIAVSQRNKLLIFDPTGIFPEELYAGSPSNQIKSQILGQKDFRDAIAKKCDLFFVTQDCPEGVQLTKELKVVNYPTIILQSRDGTALYKKEKLMSLEDLYEDLKMVF